MAVECPRRAKMASHEGQTARAQTGLWRDCVACNNILHRGGAIPSMVVLVEVGDGAMVKGPAYADETRVRHVGAYDNKQSRQKRCNGKG